jgi:hypothetical protein
LRTINSYQLDRIENVANQSMSDLCDIHIANLPTSDSFGQSKKAFTTTSNVPCGFNPSNSERTNRGQLITEDCDAIMRLPLTQSLTSKDEVTCRDIRYKVHGITIGNTVKRVTLKRTDGKQQ